MPDRTITQQITRGKNLKITDKNLRLEQLIKLDNNTVVILNMDTVMIKYRDEIKKYIKRYSLSQEDCRKYDYKPHLLAYEIYGSIELVPFILQINNMVSVTEFTNLDNGLNLFTSDINEFLNEVMIKENRQIVYNRDKINKELS